MSLKGGNKHPAKTLPGDHIGKPSLGFSTRIREAYGTLPTLVGGQNSNSRALQCGEDP